MKRLIWLMLLVGLPTFASYIPVEVVVKAVNCPMGSVLVVNDVETNLRVDDRGKLTASISGVASFPITVGIHKFETPDSPLADYAETTDTARMDLVIHLDCGVTP